MLRFFNADVLLNGIGVFRLKFNHSLNHIFEHKHDEVKLRRDRIEDGLFFLGSITA